jgi:hypothetical protein
MWYAFVVRALAAIRNLWDRWINWIDRDIAETWPYLWGPSPLICFAPMLFNFIFVIVNVPEPVRLRVVDLTGLAAAVLFAVLGWRVFRYSVTRSRELQTRRRNR